MLPTIANASQYVYETQGSYDGPPGWFFPVFVIFPIIFAIIGILSMIFWVYMLIDAIKRDTPNKVLWILGMAIFHVVASFVYYFVVYRPTNEAKKTDKTEAPITPKE